MYKLNKQLWNDARLLIEAEIRSMKAELHKPHNAPGSNASMIQWKIFGPKNRATLLYALRADMRGKLHGGKDLEDWLDALHCGQPTLEWLSQFRTMKPLATETAAG